MQEVPQDEEVHGEAGELQLRRRPRDQRQLKTSAKLRKSTPPPRGIFLTLYTYMYKIITEA